jgi:acetoin utilization protein AcuB
MRIPNVGELMTASPRTIGENITISTAKTIMQRDRIRHLPVLKEGRLVGIVSDRDIKVAESFSGPGELTVGEVMTPDPYVISEEEPINSVLLTMAEKKYGCALVHHPRSEVVIGIFTDTDALYFCGNLFSEEMSRKQAA